MFHTSNINDF